MKNIVVVLMIALVVYFAIDSKQASRDWEIERDALLSEITDLNAKVEELENNKATVVIPFLVPRNTVKKPISPGRSMPWKTIDLNQAFDPSDFGLSDDLNLE